MRGVKKVSPEETYKKVESGEALLVCAYKEYERFNRIRLKGAISWGNFKSKLASLPLDQEIIFYCS